MTKLELRFDNGGTFLSDSQHVGVIEKSNNQIKNMMTLAVQTFLNDLRIDNFIIILMLAI